MSYNLVLFLYLKICCISNYKYSGERLKRKSLSSKIFPPFRGRFTSKNLVTDQLNKSQLLYDFQCIVNSSLSTALF